MSGSALFITVFLACLVEAVEALTIVLAAGTARDWRSSIAGSLAGLLVLVAAIAVLGPAISAIPLDGLRLFVGGLLLIFGLQWLRKAILRASGNKAFRDEALSYQVARAEIRSGPARRRVTDWYAFTLSFKGVVLEGVEVAFIVLTFGANQGSIPLAAVAATTAVLLVAMAIAGYAIRAPLSRVPENSLKFVVGVMLTAFGIFWGAEGAGAHWPGDDIALLVLIPVVALYALALVAMFRRHEPVSTGADIGAA